MQVTSKLLFDRFQLLDEIGCGASGRVVSALDVTTRSEVALKILHRMGPDSLSRFKNEFRTLADVVHPNVVRLGELFEQDQIWAFSMELVRGSHLLSWVRPDVDGFDEPRLRAALAQLTSALETLHGRKLVHRDIKPDNIRVTQQGRAVLLDFGLVVRRQPDAQTTNGGHALGTAGYMAPEIVAGDSATEKSDLYALGVTLYAALTGEVPYEGDVYRVAFLQRTRPLVAPSKVRTGIPPDLEELCRSLLERDPRKRPTIGEVRALLRLDGSAQGKSPIAAIGEAFVGRTRELEEIRHAQHESSQRGLQMVLLTGDSGIGKTALAARFIRSVRGQCFDAWIATSRCHASEHVSYNAFDGIADGLARLLEALPGDQLPAILPDRVRTRVGALFPALSIRREPTNVPPLRDQAPIERIHMFDAFCELLANVTRKFTTVLGIDDVQWADSDSLALLNSMLNHGPELNLLLVLTGREEKPGGDIGSPLCAVLRDKRTRVIELRALEQASALQLGATMLDLPVQDRRVSELVDEAAGSPLFLVELAHARARGEAGVNFEDALWARVRALDGDARHVVELLAIAGAPVPQALIGVAASISSDAVFRLVPLLRREHLSRSLPSGELVCHHDRVREAIVRAIPEQTRRQLHAALAQAFEDDPLQPPMRAAQHWLSAGDYSRAARWLELAAMHAKSAAVYEQAAELYRLRLALKAVPLAASERRKLRLGLAEALACAGHCGESAEVLLTELESGTPEENQELTLRAAQQLLQAGMLSTGIASARQAMEQVGLPWRKHALATLSHLALSRLATHCYRVMPPSRSVDVTIAERQLDTLCRFIQPLAWADLLRSMELSARALHIATACSSASYMSSCLAAEAVQVAFRDPNNEQSLRLLREARGWLSVDGSARQRGYCAWASGVIELVHSRHHKANHHLLEAEQIYREECAGEAWMLVNTRGMLLSGWFFAGDHAEFSARAESWLREAQARGDAYALAFYTVSGHAALRHLIANSPETALAEIERVMRPWVSATWGVHHLLRAKLMHDILSYLGDDSAHNWWNGASRIPPLSPRYFREGFAWRRAEATFRAGLARRDGALIRRADEMLQPLARAESAYVRGFAGLTATQIAIFERRFEDARHLSRAIRDDIGKLGDFRVFVLPLLDVLSCAEGRVDDTLWDAPRSYFLQRGWSDPERALTWILPLYPWLRAQTGAGAQPMPQRGRDSWSARTMEAVGFTNLP